MAVDDVFFIECAGDEQGGNLALGERRGVRGEYLDVEAAAVAGFEGQVGDVLAATEVAVAILGARQLQPSTVGREWRDAEQGGAPL